MPGLLAPIAALQTCGVGDSAVYTRKAPALDDVVIVAALRTPLTKVDAHGVMCSSRLPDMQP
jgi:hypothetical protein